MASEMPSRQCARHRVLGVASMRPRRDGLGNADGSVMIITRHTASMRPRRDGLGNSDDLVDWVPAPPASMRPRRDGLGNEPIDYVEFQRKKASMRPRRDGPALSKADIGSSLKLIHHVKKPYCSKALWRFERGRRQPRHLAARFVGAKSGSPFPCIPTLVSTYYITVARRSIFENVLPMLSTESSILSAGPTSMSRT